MRHKKKALFLVLNRLTRECSDKTYLLSGLPGTLRDFNANGYRVIGIHLSPKPEDAPFIEGFDFDKVIKVSPGSFEFPPFAWEVARYYSLDLRRSILCSYDLSHKQWVEDAGLFRFEIPYYLLGI